MTISAEKVLKIVAMKKKTGQFGTVTFLKKDGSQRKVNGHFKAISKMVGSEKGAKQSETLKRNGLISIWSVKEKEFKSFHQDRVLDIK